MTAKLFLIGLALAGAFIAGQLAERRLGGEQDAAETAAPAAEEHFTCPMHPHLHEPHAGDCPICGMPLVARRDEPPVKADEQYPAVRVSPETQHNFGIRTAPARRGEIARPVRIYGYVSELLSPRPAPLTSPVSGRVLSVQPAGEEHRYTKGETLIELESPAVAQLQQQHIDAVAANDVRELRILRQKLQELGFTFDAMKRLVETGEPSDRYLVRAPDSGHLTALQVAPGDLVAAKRPLGEFAPSFAFSVVAQVFETQWVWLAPGQAVTMTSRSHPGAVWRGEVRQVNELGQSSTTAVKLMADFERNPALAPRLGMQARLTVHTDARQDALLVPASAVIYTGSRCVVVTALGDGRFRPVDVTVGLDDGEYTEILTGLEEGTEVAVSGQFLLDSESDLHAELDRLQAGGPPG